MISLYSSFSEFWGNRSDPCLTRDLFPLIVFLFLLIQWCLHISFFEYHPLQLIQGTNLSIDEFVSVFLLITTISPVPSLSICMLCRWSPIFLNFLYSAVFSFSSAFKKG